MRKLVVLGLVAACGNNDPGAADAALGLDAQLVPIQLGMYQVTAGAKGTCLNSDLPPPVPSPVYLRLEAVPGGGIVRHWCTSFDETTCDIFADTSSQVDALGYDPTLQVTGGLAAGDRVSSKVDVYETGPNAGMPYQCDLAYDAETIMGTTETTIVIQQRGTFSMAPYQANVPCTDDAARALASGACSDINEAIYFASYDLP